ncbi:MAG: malate dehydrogenase [Deltaproteobacteria bacterium]|nr:malate dehydrogenase [Deltaproteobacteria bacterium]
MVDRKQALKYHSEGRPGKIEIKATKPFRTQEDLSLAYTPGVAEPCLEIAQNVEESFNYTARGNLVGVISNGTAVLGLGNIGAAASKPVMEGKGILFKAFADIDVFDIEINETNPEKFIDIVASLEPTFGGINLEDIKAPECFTIETELKRRMNIPVFHDDQHGTAIITTAGLINALELTGKKASQIKVVFSGAGAAGIACAKMALNLGVHKGNIYMIDSLGLVTSNRDKLEPNRGFFAQDLPAQDLKEAIKDADVFIGVSAKDILSPEMLKTMAPKPIIFAMANPNPEITYPLAQKTRDDLIMATGRSDYPNQVNNVLGFPFIFRGTLDVNASIISEGMKMAAARSLAALAKEKVPQEIAKAYGLTHLEFGPEYILPKPLDPRVLFWEAPAIAKTAMEEGHAVCPIKDLEAYRSKLEKIAFEKFEERMKPTDEQAFKKAKAS